MTQGVWLPDSVCRESACTTVLPTLRAISDLMSLRLFNRNFMRFASFGLHVVQCAVCSIINFKIKLPNVFWHVLVTIGLVEFRYVQA